MRNMTLAAAILLFGSSPLLANPFSVKFTYNDPTFPAIPVVYCAPTVPCAFDPFTGGFDVSAVLSGEKHGKYLTIESVSDFSFNGFSGSFADPIVFSSADVALGYGSGYNGNGTPVIALDGTYADLYAVTSTEVLGLYINDITAAHNSSNYSGGQSYIQSGAHGPNTGDEFNSAYLSIRPIPEPANIGLVLLGLLQVWVIRSRFRHGGQ